MVGPWMGRPVQVPVQWPVRGQGWTMDGQTTQFIRRFLTVELSRTERLVLMLWKLERLNDAEIAAALGLPRCLVTSVRQALIGRLRSAVPSAMPRLNLVHHN